MSHRQKNKHKPRHHRHAIQPANLILPELKHAGLEASALAPPPSLSDDAGEADPEEGIGKQTEAGRRKRLQEPA